MLLNTLIIGKHRRLIQRQNELHIRRGARVLEGRGSVLGHSTKRDPGVSPQETLKKMYMRFRALYCICCIQKSLILRTLKYYIFSLFLFFYHISYKDRLVALNAERLKIRRIKADLLLYFKIFHKLIDLDE